MVIFPIQTVIKSTNWKFCWHIKQLQFTISLQFNSASASQLYCNSYKKISLWQPDAPRCQKPGWPRRAWWQEGCPSTCQSSSSHSHTPNSARSPSVCPGKAGWSGQPGKNKRQYINTLHTPLITKLFSKHLHIQNETYSQSNSLRLLKGKKSCN